MTDHEVARPAPIHLRRRLGLLTTTSLVASIGVGLLLTDGASGPANAGSCAVIVSGSASSVSNSSAINCILIQPGVVNGNVVNTSSGSITANGAGTSTGIAVNGGTITGSVINAGSITAVSEGVYVSGSVVGGITNTGTIISTTTHSGIWVAAPNFSGGISNTGTISGGLGLELAGATFSGGITNGGTISGTRVGIAVAGATFLGGIANTGTITGTSFAGIQVGASTFSGGIQNGGTIGIAGNNRAIALIQVGAFLGGISNNGSLIGRTAIELQNVSAFSGGISNAGTITSSDGNGIALLNVSTFSGGITNSGTILSLNNSEGISIENVTTFIGTISNTGSLSGAIGLINTPSVSIFNSGTITGPAGVAIGFSGGTNTLTLGPGFSITGHVLGTGADTLQLGGSGNGTFDLSTIGGSQQYEGFTTFNVISGTWTAANTFGQSQAWNVNGGTLLVSGDLSQASGIAVNAGGTLGGSGILPGTTINNGGTLAPGLAGTPGGILRVQGNLVMASAAIYLVNVSPSAASRTNVTGRATVAGTVQVVPQSGSYALGTTYTILNATGGITGTFSGVSLSSPALKATLSYDADDVFLTISPGVSTVSPGVLKPLLGPSAPSNQLNVAGAIDSFTNGGGTLPAGFQNLFNLSSQQLGNALTQLSGEAATGAQQSGFQMMSSFLSLLFDSFAMGGAGDGGPAMGFAPEHAAALPPEAANAYASVLKAPPTGQRPWNVWGAGFGGTANINGDPTGVGSNNLSSRATGFATGLDYRAGLDTLVGFALAGGGTSWSLAAGLGGGRSDAFQAGVYGTQRYGAAYLSGALAYASYWSSTSRTVTVAGSDTLAASFNAQSWGGRLEGGYRIGGWAPFSVIPYAAVQAQVFRTPGYSESGPLGAGDPFALSYSAQNASLVRSELGSRFDQMFAQTDGSSVDLFGRAAWAHDWQSNPNLSATFTGLPLASFTVNGAAPPSNLALVTAGAELRLTNGWSFLAKFDGELARGSDTYTGTARVRYSW